MACMWFVKSMLEIVDLKLLFMMHTATTCTLIENQGVLYDGLLSINI